MSKRWGLVFGLNYPGTANALNGCVQDAIDWAAIMNGANNANIHPDHAWMAPFGNFDSVSKYLNEQCTKAAMVAAIIQALDHALEGDKVVITYSGHGTIIPPGVQSWVPHDFDWNKRETWFTYDELDQILCTHEKRGVIVVVISDSCHSQADPTKRFREFGPPNDHPTKNRFLEPPPEVAPRIVADPFDRNVITADQDDLLLAGCMKQQTSADAYIAQAYHGAFTHAVMQALKANAKGSYREILLRARSWLAAHGYDQVCSGNGANAILSLPFFQLTANRDVTPDVAPEAPAIPA